MRCVDDCPVNGSGIKFYTLVENIFMPAKKKILPKEETHNGYNEKNPAQPQGAFEPDNKTTSEKAPVKTPRTRVTRALAKKI